MSLTLTCLHDVQALALPGLANIFNSSSLGAEAFGFDVRLADDGVSAAEDIMGGAELITYIIDG